MNKPPHQSPITHHPSPISSGFTLVELLVVMAVIGVLATLIVGGFRSSQIRGRDAARKGNLKEITNALEIFYSDYGKYPPASGTEISACPYDPSSGTGQACGWGAGEFRDKDASGNIKTTYFKVVPKDPTSGQTYIYKVSSTQSKYQLYAHLENTEDKNCIGGDCLSPGITDTCGGAAVCNFSITSPNTTPTEILN